MAVNAPLVQGYKHVECGTNVPIGCTITYRYDATDGCSYSVYDSKDNCLAECVVSAASCSSICGGGFAVNANMAYIRFSPNVALYRTAEVTVAELIESVADVTELYEVLDEYHVDEQLKQDVVNIYLDVNDTGGSTPSVDMYPPGAVYLSTLDTSPAELFGGSWKALVDIFPASIFAWTRVKYSSATCGAFLCGEAVCGS